MGVMMMMMIIIFIMINDENIGESGASVLNTIHIFHRRLRVKRGIESAFVLHTTVF